MKNAALKFLLLHTEFRKFALEGRHRFCFICCLLRDISDCQRELVVLDNIDLTGTRAVNN